MVETKPPEGGQSNGPARRRKHRSPRNRQLLGLGIILLALSLILLAITLRGREEARVIDNPQVARLAQLMIPDWINVRLIPENADSRRGELLEDFTGIVIHYVGNPGSTAAQNYSYFKNPGTLVNAHFLVGLEGEILQCLPLEEKSSATSERNRDTISIEVCHPDEEGKFTQETYDALLRLTAWLCVTTQTEASAVIRHYDATGKECPVYYVRNEDAWEDFQSDLADEMRRQVEEMT